MAEDQEKKEKQQEKEQEQGPTDELNLNFKAIFSPQAKKKWAVVFLLVALLIPLYFGVQLRSAPADIPNADVIAEQVVLARYERQEINKFTPAQKRLPNNEKAKLLEQKLAHIKQTSQFKEEAKREGNTLRKAVQDEHGQTYLLGYDPYQYLRYAENIVDHGYPGDRIREDGEQIDDHMLAPTGKPIDGNFHVYVSAYLYKFFKVFNSDLTVMAMLFYIPVIFSALAIIFIFFLARFYGGNLAGFFAAMVLAIHPTVFYRTRGGFADTDAYVIFFPLLVSLLYLQIFSAKSLQRKLMWSGFAALATGFFVFAWTGWWYVYDFLLAATLAYLGYELVVHYKLHKKVKSFFSTTTWKHTIYSLLFYMGSTSVLAVMFKRWITPIDPFRSPLVFLKLGGTSKSSSLWPNVYKSVAELRGVSLGELVINFGGWLFFLAVLFGFTSLFLAIWKTYKQNHTQHQRKEVPLLSSKKIFYLALVFFWFIGGVYAGSKGARWIFFAIIPLALCFALFATKLCRELATFTTHFLPKKFIVHYPYMKTTLTLLFTFLVLFSFSLIPVSGLCRGSMDSMCNQTQEIAYTSIPDFVDSWVSALKKVKIQSNDNAIITAWWDFGHLYKAFSDRAVTFDGSTQSKPQAYLVSRMFLSSTEEEALARLRMLNCGGNRSVMYLEDQFDGDTVKSVDLVEDLILLPKQQASQFAQEKGKLTPEQATELLESTHCTPPESFVITSSDMVRKSGNWGHLGLWNFSRARIIQEVMNLPQQQALTKLKTDFAMSEKYAKNTYSILQQIKYDGDSQNSWIAPFASMSDLYNCELLDGNTINCLNYEEDQPRNFIVSFKGSQPRAMIKETGHIPTSVIFMDEKGFHEIPQQGNPKKQLEDLSLVIVRSGEKFKSFVAHPALANSLFTRLFHFGGKGLKHFELFAGDGRSMQIWKVKWDEK